MKRYISMALSFALLFSISSASFASNLTTPTGITQLQDTYVVEDGCLYMGKFQYDGSEWMGYAYLRNADGFVELYAKDINAQNTRYGLNSTYDELGIANYQETSFENIIEFLLVNFERTTLEDITPYPVTIQPRDAILSNFASDLSFSNYSGSLRFTDNGSIRPVTTRIYENATIMRSSVLHNEVFGAFTSVVDMISKFPGASFSLGLFSTALGAVNGIVQNATSVDLYNVTLNYYRYATVNGSQYVYNGTDKFVRYTGINERYNTTRAYITSTGATEYSHSSAYFTNYSSQVADAYSTYQQIGVKP